jgi:hypothetical protein
MTPIAQKPSTTQTQRKHFRRYANAIAAILHVLVAFATS